MFILLHQITCEPLTPYPGLSITAEEILVNLDNVKYFKQYREVNDWIKKKGNEIYGNTFAIDYIGKHTTLVCFKDESETHESKTFF